jgi:serine/threonine-protein kinase
MTQVIGQTRISSAATVAQPPVVAIAPAAPPAYRPVGSTPDLPRRRSVWPKLLWLLALVIAGAGGYLIYERVESTLKGSSTVAVQNVLDVAKPNAVLLLHQQGFNVRLEYAASTTVAAKLVISQAPTPGTKAKKDSTVTLLISTGIPEVPVPSIKGDSRSQAASLLAAAGLTPNFVEIHSTTIAPGEVMAANPAPGSVVPKGSTVRVNISAGPAETAVPNVVSDPYANAASALQGAGFAPVQVGANSSAPLGQVIGQTPVAGTLEPPGTKIQLTVSKGPKTVTVENVVGDNQADAAQILVQEGFKVSVTTQDVTDPTQAGLVLSQSPAGGALADGASVTITVGSYVGPTTPTTTASTPVTTTNTDTTTNTTTTTSTTVTAPATTTQTTPATTTTGAATTPATPPSTTPATTNPATTTSTTIGAAPPTTTSSSTTPATTLP